MEAPEKIILSADRDTEIIKDYWLLKDYTDNIKIEYIQTDVFIEKACKWLEKNFNMPNDFEYHFRKAMERE